MSIIVVTGGCGFIGSGIVRELNDQGIDEIIICDWLGNDDKWKNLVGKKFLDIVKPENLWDWLQGKEKEIRAFIHLGACSSTVEKDADYLLENNFHYSVQLAECAAKHDIRFIYASSAATYGDGSKGFSDDHNQLDELHPLNMYGFSKHLFDLWVKREGLLEQFVGLKYFNVFGPNEYHKGRMSSVIPQILPLVEEEGVIRLFKSNDPKNFADGDQMRDFIYVKDAVKLTCSFLNNNVAGIFNIGSGTPSTWNQLAGAVFKAIDKPKNIEYFEMPEDLKEKYQNYTCADMQKLNKALKEKPAATQLEDAVVEYIRSYLKSGSRW